MAVEYSLLTQNGTAGSYWATLTTDQKNRYLISGSTYRCYSSLAATKAAINAMTTDYSKDVYIEIQGVWDDTTTDYGTAFTNKWRSLTIASRINGIRSNSFHVGISGSGYRNTAGYDTVKSANQRTTFDGIESVNNVAGSGNAFLVSAPSATIINCIGKAYNGFVCTKVGALVLNNIALNCERAGFMLSATYGDSDTSLFAFNIAAKCAIGFDGTNASASCVGNIAIGCTTSNWGTAPTSSLLAYNGGLSGEAWGSTTRFTIATTDFINYSSNNFRPALSSSPQVELIVLSGGDGLLRYDIADAIRPNYVNTTTDKADAGPFEFDHGNGLAPLIVPIAINGMASGSIMAIYKSSDMSVIASPASTSGSYSANYTYTGDTNIIVRVRKGTAASKYLPYEYNGTITSTGFSLTVAQILDPIA